MTAQTLDQTAVLTALREVVDPEIGCNIVDLGLIYDVAISGTTVAVKMTLTTPGCPMHASIARAAEVALLNLEGVERADVDVVWDPPWNPSMVTEEGRVFLGWA